MIKIIFAIRRFKGIVVCHLLSLWTTTLSIVLVTAITTLLLTTVSELSTKSHEGNPVDRDGSIMNRLSRNSAFISAVGIYIGHADPSIRRCGMLVAEVRQLTLLSLCSISSSLCADCGTAYWRQTEISRLG